MKIGISTGTVHKLVNCTNRDDLITFVRKQNLQINCIEVMLHPDFVRDFKLSDENCKYFDTLENVALHIDEPQLNHEPCLYEYMFDNYIWHPDKFLSVEKSKYIENDILIENIENPSDNIYFKDMTKKHDICCDISHALFNGINYLEIFIKMWQSKIKYFHISNCISGQCHLPFYNDPSSKFPQIVDMIKEYNLMDSVFIIETTCETVADLHNEFEYISKILNN